MRALLVPLVAALLLLPLAPADTGSWYEDSDVLGPSAVFVFDSHEYWLPLQAGDQLSATFSWDEADGSAMTWIETDPLECPITDAGCLLAGLTRDGPTDRLCPDTKTYGGTVADGSPQTVTITAPTTGWYRAVIHGVVIPDELPFHVHLSVNGAAPASVVVDPTTLGLLGGEHLWCSLL